jgi:hypothetical protein
MAVTPPPSGRRVGEFRPRGAINLAPKLNSIPAARSWRLRSDDSQNNRCAGFGPARPRHETPACKRRRPRRRQGAAILSPASCWCRRRPEARSCPPSRHANKPNKRLGAAPSRTERVADELECRRMAAVRSFFMSINNQQVSHKERPTFSRRPTGRPSTRLAGGQQPPEGFLSSSSSHFVIAAYQARRSFAFTR